LIELKLAVELASLQQSAMKAFQAASELAVQAVEIDARGDFAPDRFSETGLRQVRKMLEDYRLRVAAVQFPTRRGYYNLNQLDARIEATKRAMKLAYSLGAGVVVNRIGRVPDDDQSADWKLLVEVLNDLGQYGHHVGAFLVAETGQESGQQLAKLLAALAPGAIGVAFNPGEMIVHGYSPEEACAELGQSILHVHLTDAVQETGWGSGRMVELGRGSADIPALLGTLEEHGYRGYFTVRATGIGNPLDELAQAVQYIRKL
jgi:sugar phosphate isomerase/epimerase